MTFAFELHRAIAHDLELLVAGWLLVAVFGAIAYGVGLIHTDVRNLPLEGLHVRRTPEPPRCTVIDITEQAPPVFFDQDEVTA